MPERRVRFPGIRINHPDPRNMSAELLRGVQQAAGEANEREHARLKDQNKRRERVREKRSECERLRERRSHNERSMDAKHQLAKQLREHHSMGAQQAEEVARKSVERAADA